MLFSPNTFLENLQQELEDALFDSKTSFCEITDLSEKFYNFFQGCDKLESEHGKLLAHCCLKYIDCIENHIDNTPECGRIHIENLKELVAVVGDMSKLEDAKDAYLVYITVPIFEKIMEPDTEIWFSKELLKNFNLAVQGTRKHIRHAIVENHPLYLCRLADIICTCGDYEYQVMLLEAIFRMCSEAQINGYADQLFPTSREVANGFCSINKDHFDKDVRTFLNIVNSELKKVLSLKCEIAELGNMKIAAPKYSDQDELPIWADFNLGTRTITIVCDKDSLGTSSSLENDDDDEDFELITINVADISNVLVSRFLIPDAPFSVGFIVLFNMIGSCSVIYPSSLEAMKATQLKLAIYKCPELNALLENLLPNWFGENFKNITPVKEDFEFNQNRSKTATTSISSRRGVYESRVTEDAQVQSKSGSALSSKSSTSDALSLKNKLHAHPAEHFIRTKKLCISKIQNVEQLKEIATDPELIMLAKKQEENRITSIREKLLTDPESTEGVDDRSDDILFGENDSFEQSALTNGNCKSLLAVAKKKEIIKVKQPWPKRLSINKSVSAGVSNMSVVVKDSVLNDEQSNNVGKITRNTKSDNKNQDHQKQVHGKAEKSLSEKEPLDTLENKVIAFSPIINKCKLTKKENSKLKKKTKTKLKEVVKRKSVRLEDQIKAKDTEEQPSALHVLISGDPCANTKATNSVENTEGTLFYSPRSSSSRLCKLVEDNFEVDSDDLKLKQNKMKHNEFHLADSSTKDLGDKTQIYEENTEVEMINLTLTGNYEFEKKVGNIEPEHLNSKTDNQVDTEKGVSSDFVEGSELEGNVKTHKSETKIENQIEEPNKQSRSAKRIILKRNQKRTRKAIKDTVVEIYAGTESLTIEPLNGNIMSHHGKVSEDHYEKETSVEGNLKTGDVVKFSNKEEIEMAMTLTKIDEDQVQTNKIQELLNEEIEEGRITESKVKIHDQIKDLLESKVSDPNRNVVSKVPLINKPTDDCVTSNNVDKDYCERTTTYDEDRLKTCYVVLELMNIEKNKIGTTLTKVNHQPKINEAQGLLNQEIEKNQKREQNIADLVKIPSDTEAVFDSLLEDCLKTCYVGLELLNIEKNKIGTTLTKINHQPNINEAQGLLNQEIEKNQEKEQNIDDLVKIPSDTEAVFDSLLEDRLKTCYVVLELMNIEKNKIGTTLTKVNHQPKINEAQGLVNQEIEKNQKREQNIDDLVKIPSDTEVVFNSLLAEYKTIPQNTIKPLNMKPSSETLLSSNTLTIKMNQDDYHELTKSVIKRKKMRKNKNLEKKTKDHIMETLVLKDACLSKKITISNEVSQKTHEKNKKKDIILKPCCEKKTTIKNYNTAKVSRETFSEEYVQEPKFIRSKMEAKKGTGVEELSTEENVIGKNLHKKETGEEISTETSSQEFSEKLKLNRKNRISQKKSRTGMKLNNHDTKEVETSNEETSKSDKLLEKETVCENHFKSCNIVEEIAGETSSQEFFETAPSSKKDKIVLKRKMKTYSKTTDLNVQDLLQGSNVQQETVPTTDAIRSKTDVKKTNEDQSLLQPTPDQSVSPVINIKKGKVLPLPDTPGDVEEVQDKEITLIVKKPNTMKTSKNKKQNTIVIDEKQKLESLCGSFVAKQLQDKGLENNDIQTSEIVQEFQDKETTPTLEKIDSLETKDDQVPNVIDNDKQQKLQNLPVGSFVAEQLCNPAFELAQPKTTITETNEDQSLQQNKESNKNEQKLSSLSNTSNNQQLAEQNKGLGKEQAALVEALESLTDFDQMLLQSTVPKASSANRKRKISADNNYDETPKKRTKGLTGTDHVEEINKISDQAMSTNLRSMKRSQLNARKLYNIDDMHFDDVEYAFTIGEEPSKNTSRLVVESPNKQVQQETNVTVEERLITYNKTPRGTLVNENRNHEVQTNFDKLEKPAMAINQDQNKVKFDSTADKHQNNEMKEKPKYQKDLKQVTKNTPAHQNRLEKLVVQKLTKTKNEMPKRGSEKRFKKEEKENCKKQHTSWKQSTTSNKFTSVTYTGAHLNSPKQLEREYQFDLLMQSLNATLKQYTTVSNDPKRHKSYKSDGNKKKNDQCKYKKLNSPEKQPKARSRPVKKEKNVFPCYKKLLTQLSSPLSELSFERQILETTVINLSYSEDEVNQQMQLNASSKISSKAIKNNKKKDDVSLVHQNQFAEKNKASTCLLPTTTVGGHDVVKKDTPSILIQERADDEYYPVSSMNTPKKSLLPRNIRRIYHEIQKLSRKISNIELVVLHIENMLKKENGTKNVN